jgi:tetrahydromethanopterin S-methyltransferase subunit B
MRRKLKKTNQPWKADKKRFPKYLKEKREMNEDKSILYGIIIALIIVGFVALMIL